MEKTFLRRFGIYDTHMFQQQCILAANGYQSWRSPTGQNKIDWTTQGHSYITRLYRECKHEYSSRESFLKALLITDCILPPKQLYAHLNVEQRETFQKYYWLHLDEEVLNHQQFGDARHIPCIFLFQNLWLGAGLQPVEYIDRYDV